MIKKIITPRWDNEAKTRVRCTFEYEDGSNVTAAVSDTEGGNPDWTQIFTDFKEEDIGAFDGKKRMPKGQHGGREQDPFVKQKDLNEMLFTSKLEAFEIAEIKNSKNRVLKSKIRKSKTMTEITAYTAAIILSEMDTK